ncbi:MAG: acylphosphatase [Rhodospirillales bacterium]|nr:acylphosphatase [Rhodospirillales bacterium]
MNFQNHEKVMRIRLFGDYSSEGFSAWLVGEAESLDLCGWARPRADGSLDALFAGGQGSVEAMVELLKDSAAPIRSPRVVERLRRGDEPIWAGFHYLPTV